MQLLASTASGYALACLLAGTLLKGLVVDRLGWYGIAPLALSGMLAGLWLGLKYRGPSLDRLNGFVWLGLLPAWGFWINHHLPSCTHGCEGIYRALDGPGVVVVAVSYGLGLGAFALHRHRRAPQHLGVEMLLTALLAQGALTCAALSVQFAMLTFLGLFLGPLGLPLAAPPVAAACLGFAAAKRLGAVGARAGAASGSFLALGLGMWALDTWARGPYLGAMSQTCGWALSELKPPEQDCHYLCTVAAQGHPWLVRPLRMGTRRGRPIVVNRQLAVANAFEDLLHERWPRFGRLARRTYDVLARDISRHLLYRPIANAVFVLMLPAQWGFELFLLAFDPGEPEARIDRMYR